MSGKTPYDHLMYLFLGNTETDEAKITDIYLRGLWGLNPITKVSSEVPQEMFIHPTLNGPTKNRPMTAAYIKLSNRRDVTIAMQPSKLSTMQHLTPSGNSKLIIDGHGQSFASTFGAVTQKGGEGYEVGLWELAEIIAKNTRPGVFTSPEKFLAITLVACNAGAVPFGDYSQSMVGKFAAALKERGIYARIKARQVITYVKSLSINNIMGYAGLHKKANKIFGFITTKAHDKDMNKKVKLIVYYDGNNNLIVKHVDNGFSITGTRVRVGVESLKEKYMEEILSSKIKSPEEAKVFAHKIIKPIFFNIIVNIFRKRELMEGLRSILEILQKYADRTPDQNSLQFHKAVLELQMFFALELSSYETNPQNLDD